LFHDAYFASVTTLQALQRRVDTFLNVDVIDQPVRVGNQLFYRRRRKDQEQACICVRDKTSLQERVLVDPSRDGLFAFAAIHRISNDGTLLAYELRRGGSDYSEIHVIAVQTGIALQDHLPAGYTRGFAFAQDGSGFYYSHDDISSSNEHSIRFHEFGTPPRDPILIRRPQTRRSRLLLSSDEMHLGAVYVREDGPELRIEFLIALYVAQPRWKQVFKEMLAPHWPIIHNGRIFVWTENGASNGQVIEVGVDGDILRVVIPEAETPIREIVRIADQFFARYLIAGQWVVRSWMLNGIRVQDVPLPRNCTVQILPSLSGSARSLFYSYESFVEPLQICERPLRPENDLIPSHYCLSSPVNVRTEETGYRSMDGTEIPMILIMHRDIDPAGSQPVVLTSYGGFGVAMTPQFSVLATILVELGAIIAFPRIRGGGDFGKKWHESGRGRQRQIAIDDFLAASEWMERWNTSSPRPLGIFGGSNSGLLVAAAMTQRPALFKAVLCIAPLLDMVRYELFDQARKWRQEYGTVEDAGDFYALYAYSPYHHVEDNINYPATLFVTGDRDDRCNPAHVRKMAARLQAGSAQVNPILVDYSAERGHVPALPLSVRRDALTRRLAFLAKELGLALSKGRCYEASRV